MSGKGQRGNRGSSEEQQSQPRRMMGHGPPGMGGAQIEKAKDARGALSRLIRYLGDYKTHLVGIVF
ncbi:hypothetical protein KAS14_05430, partial [Candidatus Bathyarchaeota archaeon]|nr:hypothetical protein [Candidatus Bathyarchaeota archaeon]